MCEPRAPLSNEDLSVIKLTLSVKLPDVSRLPTEMLKMNVAIQYEVIYRDVTIGCATQERIQNLCWEIMREELETREKQEQQLKELAT